MSDKAKRNELTAKIVELASKNPEFRANLIKNPKEILEKKLKMNLPANLTIKVLEDSANSVHIVLPPAGGELDNVELEAIAGGGCWGNCSGGGGGLSCA